MKRGPRLQGKAILLLAGWFVVCLICQAVPETAQAHHGDPSGIERGCVTVAEASPFSGSALLAVGSVRDLGDGAGMVDLVSSITPTARAVSSGCPPDRVSVALTSTKLHQLNRVYRL